MVQSTEVLINSYQDMRLVSDILWKIQIWPNKQDIKAHWDKLYSNQSYWNSGKEATNDIRQIKEGLKYQNPVYNPIDLIDKIHLWVGLWCIKTHLENICITWNILSSIHNCWVRSPWIIGLCLKTLEDINLT